jgi:hypothetical protein
MWFRATTTVGPDPTMVAMSESRSMPVAIWGKVYKHQKCSNPEMIAEECQDEKRGYEVKLLKDLRASVRSIDSKVEEILDELKEHLPSLNGSGNTWSERDFYDHDAYEAD